MEILTDEEWASLSPESRHKINAYVKEAEKAKSERKWRTIDSAPKDGTEIIVWCDRGIRHVYFEPGQLPVFSWIVVDSEDDDRVVNVSPLCWMPVPEPPAEWTE